MVVEVGMIAIDIPYWGSKPRWWAKFEESVKFPAGYEELSNRQAKPIWRQSINHELMKYGGRLQPAYMSNPNTSDMLVTFRLESNYTMFLLKFA